MKKTLLGAVLISFSLGAWAQNDILPQELTPEERATLEENGYEPIVTGIETPPEFDNLRTMAEWEEIQALTIAWQSYPTILKQIVRFTQGECEIIILSENPTSTENYLMGNDVGGPLPSMDGITILDVETNSVWMRDYAANTVYGSEVDDLLLVDWIYNRPRPDDDASPAAIAEYLDLPIYCTTAAPSDLVNTGGNFMSDGQGTAFASELILEENEANNPYEVSVKTEEDIDAIMQEWMGIDRYVKMTALPYDGINHIDMHMKLLDEKTLMIGEYPPGIADGPQINANMEYVLANFNSYFDTPYDIVRVPMPDSPGGAWPDTNGAYRTYSNAVFVNETILVPTYREEYDSTAMRIWGEQMPGYNIIPIDCDNQPDPIIFASGAIHCITHSVGAADPLLIVHNSLEDTFEDEDPYEVVASVKHRTGIASAGLFWRLQGESDYQNIGMTSVGEDNWSADIPAQAVGSIIEYYVEGTANSGKVQVRPIVAPEGYWQFEILDVNGLREAGDLATMMAAYPNPASAITCVPLSFKSSQQGTLSLIDISGREISLIHNGSFPQGEQRYFFDAENLPAGAYLLVLSTEEGRLSQRIMVR